MEECEKSSDVEWGGARPVPAPQRTRSRMGEEEERILNDYLSSFAP